MDNVALFVITFDFVLYKEHTYKLQPISIDVNWQFMLVSFTCETVLCVVCNGMSVFVIPLFIYDLRHL